MARIKNWTKNNASELWGQWLAMFNDEEEAIITAIWIANRLVKDKAKSTKRKFYSIKDAWIKKHQNDLTSGRIAREESLPCRLCEGTGTLEFNLTCSHCYGSGEHEGYYENDTCHTCDGEGYFPAGDCPKCQGTGKYKTWNLYEHRFDLNGNPYCFHSYAEPDKLDDEPGADCEEYGGRFGEEELNEMALPMSGLLKLLTYIAAAKWKLQLYDGRYE